MVAFALLATACSQVRDARNASDDDPSRASDPNVTAIHGQGPEPSDAAPPPQDPSQSDEHHFPCELPGACGLYCHPFKDSPIHSTYCVGDTIMECGGLCYEAVKTCRTAAACVTWDTKLLDGQRVPVGNTAATCAETKADCPSVAMAYEFEAKRLQLIAVSAGSPPLAPGPYRSCGGVDTYCTVSTGHCAKGLTDACFFVGPPAPRLEELAKLWHDLGCEVKTRCRCPSPPTGLRCETNPKGGWKMGGIWSAYACVVR
jgi:hypothetical protein